MGVLPTPAGAPVGAVGAMHSNEVGLAQIRKWESIEYSGNHPTAADESEIMGKLMPMLISKTTKNSGDKDS